MLSLKRLRRRALKTVIIMSIRATLPLIKDPQLVALLEKALDEREEMDIRWERVEGGES